MRVVAVLLGCFLVVSQFSIFFKAESRAFSLASWRGLSAARVTAAAQGYFDARQHSLSSAEAICVYAVSCETGRARLTPITNIETYDFAALKRRIWQRRFHRVCEGMTANLGIVAAFEDGVAPPKYEAEGVWSFYNDRFVMRNGHFWGASFSEEPWERCTPEIATFQVEEGRLVLPAGQQAP